MPRLSSRDDLPIMCTFRHNGIICGTWTMSLRRLPILRGLGGLFDSADMTHRYCYSPGRDLEEQHNGTAQSSTISTLVAFDVSESSCMIALGVHLGVFETNAEGPWITVPGGPPVQSTRRLTVDCAQVTFIQSVRLRRCRSCCWKGSDRI
jgi:hypothetical protein